MEKDNKIPAVTNILLKHFERSGNKFEKKITVNWSTFSVNVPTELDEEFRPALLSAIKEMIDVGLKPELLEIVIGLSAISFLTEECTEKFQTAFSAYKSLHRIA